MPYSFAVGAQEAEVVRKLFPVGDPDGYMDGRLLQISKQTVASFVGRLLTHCSSKELGSDHAEFQAVTRLADRLAQRFGRVLLEPKHLSASPVIEAEVLEVVEAVIEPSTIPIVSEADDVYLVEIGRENQDGSTDQEPKDEDTLEKPSVPRRRRRRRKPSN